MPLNSIFLSLVLLFCFNACFAQEEETTFMVKQPVKKEAPVTIIRYNSVETDDDGTITGRDSFKLYLLNGEKKFQFQPAKNRWDKGGGLPPLEFKSIDFVVTGTTYTLLTFDSTTGEQQYKIGATAINRRLAQPYDWLGIITERRSVAYDYAVCTDTAEIEVNNKKISCYKIESHYKTPAGRGDFWVKIFTVTYISKQDLLPVKMVSESKPIKLYKPVYSELRKLKRKKTTIVTAVNWL